MDLLKEIKKIEKENNEKAVLELREKRDDIIKCDFHNISEEACELLASGVVKISEDEIQNKKIMTEAACFMTIRAFINAPLNEEMLKRIANGSLPLDGPEDKVKEIYEKAKEYIARRV